MTKIGTRSDGTKDVKPALDPAVHNQWQEVAARTSGKVSIVARPPSNCPPCVVGNPERVDAFFFQSGGVLRATDPFDDQRAVPSLAQFLHIIPVRRGCAAGSLRAALTAKALCLTGVAVHQLHARHARF